MKTVEYRAEGYASLTRTVVSGGTSGRVNVPKNWIGKRAIVILLEPTSDPDVPLPPSSE